MIPAIGLMLSVYLIVKAIELVVAGLSAKVIEQDGQGIYSRPDYGPYILSIVGAFIAGSAGLFFAIYWLTTNSRLPNL